VLNKTHPRLSNEEDEGNKKKTSGIRRLPRRKVFCARESTLTTMLYDENYKTIFHIALTILIFFGLHLIITDFKNTGKWLDFSFLGLRLINNHIIIFPSHLPFTSSYFSNNML